ncbi:MAG TPA: Trm112 family protein [Anaerolineae bacterium]|nr:Trm112 family protein [Anaerolineae bacterium]
MKKLLKLVVLLMAVAAAGLLIAKMRGRCKQSGPPAMPERSEGIELPAFDESELGGQVSPDLLSILVCPEDRGPLTLSSDGKWLVNPRNGYRYPIRKGIPVMLIEEGRRNQDRSLIQ